MSNKKLAISLNVLEVVIQTLVFLSLIIALMMGTLGLNAGQLWKCLIVVICGIRLFGRIKFIFIRK